MRAIYLGKDKPAAITGLRFLVENGIEVAAVVGPEGTGRPSATLSGVASSLGIPTESDEGVYERIASGELREIDVVVSFLFWKRIREPLIVAPRFGCINFHPAPLPEFRGVSGYSLAVYENLSAWGVTAHFVEDHFDTGDIIEVRRFHIDAGEETALSLEKRSQPVLLHLFKDVILRLLRGEQLPRIPQGEGRYFSRQDFEELRRIDPSDAMEDIQRKVRAFWFPPYGGAYVDIQGTELTLVNEFLLRQIAGCFDDGRHSSP